MAYRQNDSQRRNDVVRFDLMEHIGVLSMKDNGWIREVNIVSWNNGAAKVDIREWDPEHKRMSKGVTLYEEEAETLTKALARRYGLRLSEKEPAPAASAADPQIVPAAAAPAPEETAACVAESASDMEESDSHMDEIAPPLA